MTAMSDEDVIKKLRIAGSQTTRASEVAGMLAKLSPDGLSAWSLISYFKRAFPTIPLDTLQNATDWHRVSPVGMSDAAFDQLLAPWFPSRLQRMQ
jgi:hypothetical protein